MNELNFSGVKILVIGDIMVDRYLEGNITGNSPEADVPIFRKLAVSNYPGGAANVSVNISNLGGETILIGLLGKDNMGQEFTALLKNHTSIQDETFTVPGRITTVKTRIISDNNHVLRIDTEDDTLISDKLEEKLLIHIQNIIKKYHPDGVIFQDYNKGILTPKIISQTISTCNANNILTYVDPKFDHIEYYQSAHVFKPNKKELEYLLQEKLTLTQMLSTDILVSLRNRMECKYLVVTVSKDGIVYVDDQGVHHLKGIQRNVIDVCGAGDTVISVLSIALSAGYDIKVALTIANIAGGQVCQYSGVKAVDYQDLTDEYLNQ